MKLTLLCAARVSRLLLWASCASGDCRLASKLVVRYKPACKAGTRTTQVEPILNEQGFGSYIWLGDAMSASPESLKSHGWIPPS
jgi:hypothetical protein